MDTHIIELQIKGEVNTFMYTSRADFIRENAIALLQDELSDVYTAANSVDNQTQSQTQTHESTSWFEHLLALSVFVGLGYALFVAVTR
jgi:hypothetical protein